MQTKADDVTFSLMFEVGRLIRSGAEKGGVIPLAHFETLRFIEQRKDPSMRDVASYLRVTAPSATALIAELVGQKYLVRTNSASDRRQVHVELTAKGKKVVSENLAKRKRVVENLLRHLSAKERSDLHRILCALLQNTNNTSK